MANRRALAPQPNAENPRMMEEIIAMKQTVLTISNDVGFLKQAYTTMNGQSGTNVGGNTNTGQPSNAGPVVPVAVAPVVSTTGNVLPEPKPKDLTEVIRLIHGYMWTPRFRSNDQAEIEANNRKPRWNTKVFFNDSPNKELVDNLMAFLVQRSRDPRLRNSDIREKVHNHFRSRCHLESQTSSKRDAAKAKTRRSSREGDHLKRRGLTYAKNKAAIDAAMGRDCSNLIQKGAMSDGESGDETPGTPGVRIVHVKRPSWRSNEFNHFLEMVDLYARVDLGNNSRQLMERRFHSVVTKPVPDSMLPPPPQWTVRDDE
ncbi:hypothetical protein INT47_012156 [Mucor saturninus]|uniref:Uncharacterized protein n=1 Tax=Mucor saturninus TaxID=64648 RepID=A0A8H7UPW5_9FUNG|nr:hypothetical protein INT47_012156 [Mucor saturninus]